MHQKPLCTHLQPCRCNQNPLSKRHVVQVQARKISGNADRVLKRDPLGRQRYLLEQRVVADTGRSQHEMQTESKCFASLELEC